MALDIPDEMVEQARQAIEDAAIERRDGGIFVICGNGVTVRNRDGGDSAIHRMRSDEAFRIGLRAIEPRLVALIAAKALRDAADAMDVDDPRDEGPRWTRVDLGYYGESEWLRARADHIEAR